MLSMTCGQRSFFASPSLFISYSRILNAFCSGTFLNWSSFLSTTLSAIGVRGISFILFLFILAFDAFSYVSNQSLIVFQSKMDPTPTDRSSAYAESLKDWVHKG